MGNDFKRGIRIYLETSDYGKGIDAMVAATQKYEKELEDLRAEAQKMTAAGQAQGKAWDDLDKKIKRTEQQLKKNQVAEADYRSKLQQTEKVLNNLSGVSYDELIEVQKRLQRETKKSARDGDEHAVKLKQLERVNKEVAKAQGEMNSSLGRSGGFFSRAADSVNKYFNVGMAFIAGITGVSLAFRKLSEDVAKLDDIYSDVMKTTGMTRNEVVELNEELKQFDTRTAREELNKLASEAGKIGRSSKEDILAFVDAGNQIRVALGEDLGEDAIKNIGKMVSVFENSSDQLKNAGLREQMLSVGSAINELGASSTASEKYLVEFAARMGGISKQANIGMGDILGYASSLDQDMQQVEMSATALQQFIMKIMGEPAKFAKIAGLEVNHFNNLLANDTNYAIKTVLKALNEKGGFQQLIPIFEEMNLDGARAVGVLSAMAGSIENVDTAQKVANQAMWEGTSITKEYSIKNNNLAAQLDKAKNRFHETALELGESLNPILLKSVKGTTYLIKVLVELPKWLKENKDLIVTLGIVMTVYSIAVNKARLANLGALAVEKMKIFWTKASTAATLLQVAATGYLTGGVRAANLATKAFFATLGLNPFIAIAMLIAAATIAIYKWVESTNKASESHKIFHDRLKEQKELTAQYSKTVIEEKTQLEGLVNAIMQTNNNTDLRLSLIKQLKEQYPGFLSFLSEEKMTNDMLKGALMEVNEQYSIRLKNAALSGKAESFENAAIKAEQRRIEIAEEIKRLSKENSDDSRKRISELSEEDRQLQRNIKAYQQKSTKYRTEAQLNDAEIKKMNTIEYAQSQLKVWYEAAQDFEKKFKEARANGQKDQADYYQQQLTEANNYVKFYIAKRNELKKAEELDNKKTPGGAPVKLNSNTTDTKTDPFKDALDKRENDYKQWLLKLQELRRTEKITEDIFNDASNQAQLDFLNDKKKLQQKFGKETVDTEIEISNAKLKFSKTTDEVILREIKNQQSAGFAVLKSGEDSALLMLQESLAKRIITQENYEYESKLIARNSAEAKLALAETTLNQLMSAEFSSAEAQREAIKAQKEEIDRLKAELTKAGIEFEEILRKPTQDYAEMISGIFGNSFSEIGEMFILFKNNLDKLKTDDLKSWTDWGMAIGGIVQGALAVATRVNDEYWQYKANALEADKQRELTAAGDSAEAREAITQKYAEKELELKKKQSSADTVLKVAQSLSAGALAVMQAFAQLGPIGGTVAAIMVGGITALQVANIIKQNEAIQNTTLDSSVSGSTGSATGFGSRVISTPQAAEGRWDVIGRDDNRIYRNVPYRGVARTGIVTTPTLVGEVGDEAIIDNPTLRNIRMNAPWVLSTIRRLRVPQRAAGNYSEINTEAGNSQLQNSENSRIIAANIEVMQKLITILRIMIDNGIDANIYLDQLEKKIELRNKSVRKGSLK